MRPSLAVDLHGDVALVTGASSGLGRRFSRVLASAGAKVAFTGRRLDRLESLRDEIIADGGEALAVQMDVRASNEIAATFDLIEKEFGSINILVNNTGLIDAEAKCDGTRIIPFGNGRLLFRGRRRRPH